MNPFDQKLDRLERQLDQGVITRNEYRQEVEELNVREAEERAQEAFEQEMARWR